MTTILKSLAPLVALGIGAAAINAHAYTLDDPYGAAFNSGNCSTDHCGGSPYDTAGIDVSLVNHLLTISVFTNFHEPNPTYPSIFDGDLFLTVDGTRYVLDTSSAQASGAGAAYQVTGATRLMKAGAATPVAGRPTQDVLYVSDGTPVGGFNFSVAPGAGLLNVLNYSILDSEVGLSTAGLHLVDLLWTMICANDVAGGTVSIEVPLRPSTVPLPGTLPLIFAGALGLAAVRRRAR